MDVFSGCDVAAALAGVSGYMGKCSGRVVRVRCVKGLGLRRVSGLAG